ncbi:prenyltransferase [Neptuniibacter sp. SY11_33]|uniref:prenyltransferase n=1 Tax=Neptuniibacter sp. SY11_33 TaxID=3398215 RepID=UPI0039F5D0D6
MIAEKYLFRHALRPFSFSVALIVCLTGILSAYREGFGDSFLATLILMAGLLLQAGVNLINDYADLSLPNLQLSLASQKQIRFNFNLGLGCILFAAVIGCYLISVSGILLLLISVIGIVGALGYTMEPINYKRRGLAVFFVFWLMGILMVSGAYYVLTKELSYSAFLISIPVSLFVSLLLLSNELRDFEEDATAGIKTLTVKIGYARASQLYKALLICIYLGCLALSLNGSIPFALVALLSIPFVIKPLKLLALGKESRQPITKATGRSFLIFGICYCSALLF